MTDPKISPIDMNENSLCWPWNYAISLGISALVLLGSSLLATADESHRPVALDPPLTYSDITKNFFEPPSEAKPWVYAFWINGNVTRAGITSDLEAMKRVGIGGLTLMEVDGTPAGPLRFCSPEWREMFKHTVSEVDRLGLQLTMNNDAGWCGSGGPWITPEHGEQQLVWTETFVQGPSHYEATLPKPEMAREEKEDEAARGFYKDVAVLAFPTLQSDDVEMAEFSPVVSASVDWPQSELQKVVSGKNNASVTLPKPEPGKPQYVQVGFARPFTARTLYLALNGSPDWRKVAGEIQVSADGINFQTVRQFTGKLNKTTLVFESVSGRFFRILFTSGDERMSRTFQVRGLQLSPHTRIADMRSKTFLERENITPRASYPDVPKGLVIDKSQIIDLSSKMDLNGCLKWDMPPGRWTLLRIGYAPRGILNHPSPESGRGLECDKLSKEAVEAHFAGLMGKLIQDVGPLAGKALVATHIDSWETGTQNWTKLFREEFQSRRGYDLLRFLPVMTGRVVDRLEISERFLWDLRQTVSELVAENYSGRMAELAHQYGIKLSIESYGSGPYNDLDYGAPADETIAEFWWRDNRGLNTPLLMSSIAHVYGKPIVGAEAFTSDSDEKWLGHPAAIKTKGDWAFTAGINRFIIHRYTMQPWPERRPGLAMSYWGLHYEQGQTWWEQSGPWHQYLARCQYLLQQGFCVADICYLQAEGAPLAPSSGGRGPSLERPGYAFDLASAQALCDRFSVKDGNLVLPDGMSYRVLVLPETPTMTPKLLRKIKQLVADGATVIGARPLKSPSLSDHPACDREVATLADEVWGNSDGKSVGEHRFGKGRMIWGTSPQEVLAKMDLPPDFVYSGPKGEPKLRYIHRAIGDADFYFVANPSESPVDGLCKFRVQGKRPELWQPQTGAVNPVVAYEEKGGMVSVPVHLDAAESVFIVFQPHQRPFDAIASITLDGAPVLSCKETERKSGPHVADIRLAQDDQAVLEVRKPGTYEVQTVSGKVMKTTVPHVLSSSEITGSWDVKFPPNLGAPSSALFKKLASWSDNSDSGVQYFSGTAVYEKTFQVSDDVIGKGRCLYLDLGDVQVIAEVKVNGKPLGILWKPPYQADLTKVVQPGANSLEIKVTNLWPNRFIGDEHLPEDSERNSVGALIKWPQWLLDGKPSPTGRFSFTTWRRWAKDGQLRKSGLLGPVTLFSSVEIPLAEANGRYLLEAN